jgi:FkbM family methyltransferase
MAAEIEPFGTYPLTTTQRRITRLFHGTLLGITRLRRGAINRFKAEAGNKPVDGHLFGLKVRFHPYDNQTDSKGAVCGSVYNAHELGWLRRALPPGGTFIDIGANMGFFTLYAAKRGAKVIAIEPLPELFERLSFNMAINDLSGVLLNEAVGPAFGEVHIQRGNSDLGNSRVGTSGHSTPMRPLDAILTQAAFTRVDLLKIDVEGFEDQVLCPFFRTAPQSSWPISIIMEHSSHAQWSEDLLEDLKQRGYRPKARNRANMWLQRS